MLLISSHINDQEEPELHNIVTLHGKTLRVLCKAFRRCVDTNGLSLIKYVSIRKS